MKNQYLLNTGILANVVTLKFFSSRYKCRNCGNCCSGKLFKSVHLHEGDGPRIARGLSLDLKQFYAKYCDQVNYQTYLKFPCPGLELHAEGTSCKVYDCRGTSCRLFPLSRIGNNKLMTIGIDLRCPAGAELAEEFRKEAAARKAGLHRN